MSEQGANNENPEALRRIEASDGLNLDLIRLLKERKYSDLFVLARSPEKARGLGLSLGISPWSLNIRSKLNPDQIRVGLNLIGRYSKVDFGRAWEGSHSPVIDIGTYYAAKGIELPDDFLRGLAEIHVEEWLHVGQELRIVAGQPHSLSGLTDDMEIDVAAYMVQKGVNLSDYFLERNGRKSFLKEKDLIK